MLDLEYLSDLRQRHAEALQARVNQFSLSGYFFAFNTAPEIMGVINLSPDSWYRESVCLTAKRAIQRAEVLRAQGAAIIDIGAESTLSHAARIDDALQRSKLLPIVKAVRSAGILVSVETYQPSVAQACLEAGANVLNLTGTEQSDEMYRMVAGHDAGVIICYVQGANVREVGDFESGGDPIETMREFFERELERATRQGVTKILIDPGLGFYYRNLQDSAFRVRHQLRVFLNTFRLRTLGAPVCHALPHAFEFFGEEVRSAEAFFAVAACLGRTDLFRTHEVSRVKAVLDALKTF